MLYFSVEYSAGFFCDGTAYIRAMSKDGAKNQVKRSLLRVHWNMRTLKRITKSDYETAKKSPNKVPARSYK